MSLNSLPLFQLFYLQHFNYTFPRVTKWLEPLEASCSHRMKPKIRKEEVTNRIISFYTSIFHYREKPFLEVSSRLLLMLYWPGWSHMLTPLCSREKKWASCDSNWAHYRSSQVRVHQKEKEETAAGSQSIELTTILSHLKAAMQGLTTK